MAINHQAKRPEMACPACRFPNPLGRSFCARCGINMHAGQSTPAEVLGAEKKRGGPRRAMVNLLRASLFVALVAVLGLALWPMNGQGRPGALADGRQVDSAMNDLDAAARSDRILQVIVTESQVNGYLSAVVENNKRRSAPPGKLARVPESLNVEFRADELLFVSVDHWGPLRLSTRLRVRIHPENPGFEVDSAWVGHLPVPAWLGPRLALASARRSKLAREERLLPQLRPLKSNNTQLAVRTKRDGR